LGDGRGVHGRGLGASRLVAVLVGYDEALLRAVQRQPLRLKFGHQAIRRFLRLLVVDLISESPVADDTVVYFVALVAHGLTAGSGGSVQHSQSPMIAEVRSMSPVVYQLNPVPGTGFSMSKERLRCPSFDATAPLQPGPRGA